MINGNVNEFIDGLYYGDERWFIYRKIKYFIQGWVKDGKYTLMLDQMNPDPGSDWCLWEETKDESKNGEVVESFLASKIFDGKTFWEVEHEIEWVDD